MLFMETRYIPIEETDAQPTRKDPELSWTESEWFQTWLQLAREKYQQEPQHEVH